MNDIINMYNSVKECYYKDEYYSVRDNGAIMRHPKNENKPRPLDNKWTFGKKNNNTGYMMFSSNIRVHQIVATAFYGQPEDSKMVIDHLDTNRCNNRPENLKWVTRLENALNNPITRKRIIICCGSIEEFLKDPSKLRQTASEPNTQWMRTVSKEEAAKCLVNLTRWAKEDNKSNRNIDMQVKDNSFGESWDKDWMFREYRSEYRKQLDEIEEMNKRMYEQMQEEMSIPQPSLTEKALQLNWKTPSSFPRCPTKITDTPLKDYASNLSIGSVFSQNEYGISIIIDYGISKDGKKLVVLCTIDNIKPYALAIITFENGKFIHKSEGSFFQEDGGRKYFTIALGNEWTTGKDVFDDFC